MPGSLDHSQDKRVASSRRAKLLEVPHPAGLHGTALCDLTTYFGA